MKREQNLWLMKIRNMKNKIENVSQSYLKSLLEFNSIKQKMTFRIFFSPPLGKISCSAEEFRNLNYLEKRRRIFSFNTFSFKGEISNGNTEEKNM